MEIFQGVFTRGVGAGEGLIGGNFPGGSLPKKIYAKNSQVRMHCH